MADKEESPEIVPVAVSTVQTEDEFAFDKFATKDKLREFYLGPYTKEDLFEKISNYYSIPDLIQFLKSNPDKFHNVTLQFPDSLVMDSSIVSRLLQDAFPNSQFHKEGSALGSSTPQDSTGSPIRRFWILADTAYSSCCVDEVAAEHVNADLVIHFGDACLNVIQKLPVVYLFGKPYLDCQKVVEEFTIKYSNKDAKVCLMADAPYSYHIETIYKSLVDLGYSNIAYSQVNKEMAGPTAIILGQSEHQLADNDDNIKEIYTLGNRVLYGTGDVITDSTELQETFELFYLTIPQDPHLLYLTTVFNDVALYDVADGTIMTGPFPSLMKRYKFMNVARTSGCIGILINTLSLRNTKETINKLIHLIKSNGKKHYLFVVGKPNVAKLANFETIDIWCILGCGQSGIIIDQFNEFYKPIITPYELTLALNKEITWTGKWITDFENALQNVTLDDIEGEADEEKLKLHRDNLTVNDQDYDSTDSDAPEFDVVTGKFVSTSRPLRALKHLELEAPSNSSTELVKNVRGGTVIKGTVSTSVSNLQSRHWGGLGTDFKDDEEYDEEGAAVEEGITGVARSYQFDRTDAAEKNQQVNI
ncbi:2-(3-amino-3-carboxypropyl)histidine synthase subunit 2 [Monosporozyma unispora]|nr:Diphthamide biosynthesis protein 2 [Kazachstania unispora]